MNYQAEMQQHLAKYRAQRLGIFEEGMYKGQPYPHILPWRFRFLNLLEAFQSEIQSYLQSNRLIRLHQYFHHLNSSQAFAFNFFPYLNSGSQAARSQAARQRPRPDAEIAFGGEVS
jgi:hypothetical protein